MALSLICFSSYAYIHFLLFIISGQWCDTQRKDRRRLDKALAEGVDPRTVRKCISVERVAALDEIGFIWVGKNKNKISKFEV